MIKNILSLYSAQISRLILPILMLPIITSRLSEGNFGIYIYALAFSSWISLIIEYGFNISSTRKISSLKDRNKRNISDVVVATQSAKYIISAVCVLFIPFCLNFVPIFKGQTGWVVTSYLFGFLSGILPQYYFQAIENLKLFSLSELFASLLLLFFTYNFLNEDPVILMVILITSRLFCVLVCTCLLIKTLGFDVVKIDFKKGWWYIKNAFSVFFFQFMVSLYTVFNIIFLGFFVSASQVALYGAAERLIRAGLAFYGQASNVIFPRVTSLKASADKKLEKTRFAVLLLFSVFGFVSVPIVWNVSPIVIPLVYSDKLDGAIELINIMAWVIPAIAMSNVLSFQYFLVEGKEVVLNKVIVCASAINLILSYSLITRFGAVGMVYSWVALEWLITVTLFLLVFFKRSRFISIGR
ncbi:oligosaccharide flippase family protein [Vibrio vulnificus]|nr:oligosaccharide flippase family protein [Vibrio vulnificus]